MKVKTILITSVGTATSVGLIKHLKKFDYCICGTDINKLGYTAGSLMVDKYFQVPLAFDKKYNSILEAIVIENNVDLIIPINDNEIFTLVSGNFDACRMVVPSLDVINLARDKKKCSDFVKNLGIVVPEELSEDYNGKCIIRDKFGVGSRGIVIADKLNINSIDKKNQFVQKFIAGEEYTVDVLSDLDGVPIYIIPRKRIEVKSGVATKVLIEENMQLILYTEKILNHIKLPGFCNLQFIKNINNDYFFIEINYRIGGCSSASMMASENLINRFVDIIEGQLTDYELNSDVRWGSIVTRYYEEKLYLNEGCIGF